MSVLSLALVGVSAALLWMVIRKNRRRWLYIRKLVSDDHLCETIKGEADQQKHENFVFALVWSGIYASPCVIAYFFVNGAEFLLVGAAFFQPLVVSMRFSSWILLVQRATENSLRLLRAKRPTEIMIAYLRDQTEERRIDIHPRPSGMPSPGEHAVTVQWGLGRLIKSVPKEVIFGFWDIYDPRLSPDFSPLLSSRDGWRADVELLCSRANLIILDISTPSPSVEWEAKLIISRADLRDKTLLLRSRKDQALPIGLSDLPRLVRWTVYIDTRGAEGGSAPMALPSDFLQAVRHLSA